jgi:hypothetical protein
MRQAYVGLSIALAVFIIAQAVNRPVLLAALAVPAVVFVYGIWAEETLPEVKKEDDEKTADGNGD